MPRKDLEQAVEVVKRSIMASVDKVKVIRLLRLLDKSSAEMSAAELKEAREAAGLTLEQAAKLIGVHRTVLTTWERVWNAEAGSVTEKIDTVYGLAYAGRPAPDYAPDSKVSTETKPDVT